MEWDRPTEQPPPPAPAVPAHASASFLSSYITLNPPPAAPAPGRSGAEVAAGREGAWAQARGEAAGWSWKSLACRARVSSCLPLCPRYRLHRPGQAILTASPAPAGVSGSGPPKHSPHCWPGLGVPWGRAQGSPHPGPGHAHPGAKASCRKGQDRRCSSCLQNESLSPARAAQAGDGPSALGPHLPVDQAEPAEEAGDRCRTGLFSGDKGKATFGSTSLAGGWGQVKSEHPFSEHTGQESGVSDLGGGLASFPHSYPHLRARGQDCGTPCASRPLFHHLAASQPHRWLRAKSRLSSVYRGPGRAPGGVVAGPACPGPGAWVETGQRCPEEPGEP
ncbi:zinc finger protein ZIC 5-like [Talpa occidentalis]|uniref:zinc finger protein ZIC 5-like n=1 Tax=Talpa occidentalis TaxID=50954 RepID=UPI0023F9949C|nr:zinc finger protein ZIC 5-like [Talpa occidentalis]